MDFSNYSKEIQELSQNLLESRAYDRKLTMEYCAQLLRLGEAAKDSYLLGFAYYYQAECYFAVSNYHSFMETLSIGIEHQQKASMWMLLVRSYNLLGINAYTCGNVTIALDYYLSALGYCEKYDYEYERAMLYANIAQIYQTQKSYEKALEYYSGSQELFLKESSNPFAVNNCVKNNISMGYIYLRLGNRKAAVQMAKEAQGYGAQVMDESMTVVMCFLSVLAHDRGDLEECDDYIRRVLDQLDNQTLVLDIYDDIFMFVDFLLDTKHYEAFLTLMKKIDDIIGAMDITKIGIDLIKFRIRYYKAVDDRENYLEECAKLYELETINAEQNAEVIHNSTMLRFKLEEARKTEEKLEKEKYALIEKSETDQLTGLPNRYRLNDYLDKIFEQAFHNRKSLGVEMVDIDYFKGYNDTYGHQAGDEVIQALAGVLKEVAEDESIFCARYGGDEFIVVYYDKSDEEIIRIAKKISSKLAAMHILHEKSEVSEHVTISQGIRNTVPRRANKVWDYQFAADSALYQVKENGRGGICLINRMGSAGMNTIIVKGDEMNG